MFSNSPTVEIIRNRLAIDGRTLDAPHPETYPSKLAWQNNRLLVLYGTSAKKSTNRNVMAYDRVGNVLWQVQHDVKSDDGLSAFVDFCRDEESGLITTLATWSEVFYLLDDATGAVKPIRGLGRLDP